MIETLATEMSEAIMLLNEANSEDQETGLELTSMLYGILQQCSDKIFQVHSSTEYCGVFSQRVLWFRWSGKRSPTF